jgi:hypothetical protein
MAQVVEGLPSKQKVLDHKKKEVYVIKLRDWIK